MPFSSAAKWRNDRHYLSDSKQSSDIVILGNTHDWPDRLQLSPSMLDIAAGIATRKSLKRRKPMPVVHWLIPSATGNHNPLRMNPR